MRKLLMLALFIVSFAGCAKATPVQVLSPSQNAKKYRNLLQSSIHENERLQRLATDMEQQSCTTRTTQALKSSKDDTRSTYGEAVRIHRQVNATTFELSSRWQMLNYLNEGLVKKLEVDKQKCEFGRT